jgi:hypothetical protein
MIPCKLERITINNDKDLIIIKSKLSNIYVISSIKWKTAYIHKSNDKCYLIDISDRYDLIRFDRMGFRTTYENIDRFMKDEKHLTYIIKLLEKFNIKDEDLQKRKL